MLRKVRGWVQEVYKLDRLLDGELLRERVPGREELVLDRVEEGRRSVAGDIDQLGDCTRGPGVSSVHGRDGPRGGPT